MVRLKIKEVLKIVNGCLASGGSEGLINGVSTDSRTVNKGELFFALKGPRFDGNKFVGDVFKKGAAGAVVSSEARSYGLQFGIVEVIDTLKALGDLALYWRERHPVPLIAISGSCGKTTTKDMIASILKNSRPIIKTEGNLNNLIGLPLTIFNLNNVHKAAVVELGISEKGEMKRLAQICKPDVAILTNIGEAHTATLDSVAGVASAKGELFENMNGNGIAVINIDDPWLKKIAENISAKKITFSLKSKADVMLKEASVKRQEAKSSSGISASFLVMGEEIPVKLKYTGMHNLYNAAAAIAATFPLGVTKEEIMEGLYAAETMRGRMEIVTLRNGITIIDDTYNANPLSMEAALKTLADMEGRKIAVLGDMFELGEMSDDAHKKVGMFAQDTGIDMLFTIGGYSDALVSGAMEKGMLPDKIYKAHDKAELIKALNNVVKEGDVILIKGSRAAAMEEVSDSLKSIN
ncbi:MAG TPA: UDP-N-acetylmuramoyl-tripeptide--D-alanyl-D-alanine ligase [Thermodesulfobacteriota bacterium]|nr:UDP-N-acetylmuramoyl-tripeptide--D-alanyl-D-alanine ligase [Thermodesulfobacteriota bacterium]